MNSYYFGDLYRKLKDMEKELSKMEEKIALAAYNNIHDEELIRDYRVLRNEFKRWMRKTVFEKEDIKRIFQ